MKCYNAVEIIPIVSLSEHSMAHLFPWSLLHLFLWVFFCLLHIHMSQGNDHVTFSVFIGDYISLNPRVARLSWDQCGTWEGRGPWARKYSDPTQIFLQVLEMFILVLQQCHKENEDKWKRLSRQVADIILPMLAKQQVCLHALVAIL